MEKIVKKFDKYIESRISIVINWLWKSGLFLFMIGLLFQNLNVQKTNSNHIVENSNAIKEIITDIKYLRRDVDIVLFTNKPRRLDPNG